jgi:KDO2-lipid IV(A) lauroyltransferase
VKYENFELFEKVYKEGNGVLIATLHMGAFEASLKLAKYYDLYDVIRRTKNPYLDKMMNDNRKRTGVNLIYKDNNTMKHLINAIKNKAVVALFSDHYQGSSQTEVEFFGRRTKASSGAVTLSMKYNIPVLVAYNLFNEDNTCTIYFDRVMELELTDDKRKDIDYNTQRLTDIFEEIIKKYPEQWMWFHKRWKN